MFPQKYIHKTYILRFVGWCFHKSEIIHENCVKIRSYQINVHSVEPSRDRPKSVRNRCVIEAFGVVFILSRCFLDFSVSVGAFVIGLSQIFPFFTWLHVPSGLFGPPAVTFIKSLIQKQTSTMMYKPF